MEYLADAEMDEVEQYRIDRYFFILLILLFFDHIFTSLSSLLILLSLFLLYISLSAYSPLCLERSNALRLRPMSWSIEFYRLARQSLNEKEKAMESEGREGSERETLTLPLG